MVLAGTAAANGCGRSPCAVEQAEVVGARAASGDLEGVALHPGARVERLVVGDRGPRGDELARLVLHPLELRALVRRRVPGQHHPADPLVVLAVADHRDAAAAGVASWAKKLISSTRLPNRSSSAATSSQEFGVRDHDEPPLLGRDPDRVDVAEPAVVVELGVVVVQDVEVREPLAPRHQPAHRVRDLERLAAVGRPIAAAGSGGPGAAPSPVAAGVGSGRHLRLRRARRTVLQFVADQPERSSRRDRPCPRRTAERP